MITLNAKCLLCAAAVLLAGCGKQERVDAVQFAKALTEKKAAFASANAIERELVSSARAWAAGIVAGGAGRGAALDKNAAAAEQLAKSAAAVSAKLSEVRQAIDDQPLKEEYPRSVRNELTMQLTSRQRMLQDMRALLQQTAPQFLEYKQSRTYKGDSYPDGIAKLDALFGAYKVPQDALGAALEGLQSKYNFTAGEL